MGNQTKKGANKIKRTGSRKNQIARYYAYNYAHNKLRRILDSNGYPAAQSWAAKHLCTGLLAEIMQRRVA